MKIQQNDSESTFQGTFLGMKRYLIKSHLNDNSTL